jgi:plastocyanin
MKRSLLACLVLSMVCFMLAACGSTSPTTTTTTTAAGSSPQEVKISIGDFYVRSPVTTFTTGTKYQFVVTNVGTHHHDFLIMHPMKTMAMTMDQVYQQALTSLYNIAPNETKTLDFTFDHTAPAGMLEFSCHYGGHYEAGMHQAIVVNAAPGASVSPYSNNAIPLAANSQTSGTTTGPCDQPITTKIVNNTFTPASVSLKMGDTLSVTNTGSDTYTLTTVPEAGIRFTSVDPGETEYVAFPKAGTFILSSQEHPEAKATVIVSTTAGTTCGMTPVATVSFDANYADASKDRYFFTPTQVTIKVGQSITLSNLSDQDLTFKSNPDANLGDITITKNEHQELRFKDNGTYTISCVQFSNEKFVVTVQGAGGGGDNN